MIDKLDLLFLECGTELPAHTLNDLCFDLIEKKCFPIAKAFITFFLGC